MIVRPAGDDIQLITQPDHAHLARRVMAHCVPLATRLRRDSILHAIAEHDNGWAEEDAAPRVNTTTKRVFDFISAPPEVRQAVWPRGVARLARDPWAAALVAQHAITVYDRFHSESEWSPFFRDMEAARDELLRTIAEPLEDLLSDYAFVRLADLISLTFCVGWADEQRFGEWAVQRFDARIVVTPDAFGGADIPIEIGARVIRDERYVSDLALRRAMSEARPTTLRGMVTGPSAGP